MSLGKIKEFDMCAGNWTLYCERVEMYFCANAIKQELKLPTLISLVGDEVYELMVNLASPKKPAELEYNELVKLVRDHLQPKPSIMAERYKFRQRRQEAGESVTQYLAALKKMAKYCEFEATLDENLRDQFVCGVSSDLTRQRLFSEPGLTYARAVTLASALEAAERDAAAVDSSAMSRGSTAVATTSAVHALHVAASSGARGRARRARGSRAAAPAPAQSRGASMRCSACGGQHSASGCRYSNFVCNSCKNKGHLKKMCPYGDGGWRSGPIAAPASNARAHGAQIQIPVLRYPPTEMDNFKIDPMNDELRAILDRHRTVFSGGLGRYTGGCARLRVREGAAPVFCRARSVPFAMRERVDAELDAMLRDGVIEPVDCSDWATPLVLVPKDDGALRICADFKVTLNPVLMVDRYPLPRVDELLANLAGGEEFTKIDLSQAYNQICLSDDSKTYTVINTHRGLFKYNRLVYGLASSSGIFQRIISSVVDGVPGVQCFADDLILTAKTRSAHLRSLETLFQRLEAAGLKVKPSKCSFLKKEVRYLGFIVDQSGIRPDPEKLSAIKSMPSPGNVSELKSFLGMVNFYARFVRNLSEVLHPLHELLRSGVRWEWTARQARAFERVKRLLMSSHVLAHYDPRCKLVLVCDASGVGVGGVLSQRDTAGEERAVAYVSRKLTRAEQGYAQIHREALAIVFCVKKFHQYLFGQKFLLKSDCKPLISILGPQKGIPTMAASRMQRWALILSAYDFDIEYVGTSTNCADILSRLPITESVTHEPPEQTYLHFAADAMLLDNCEIRKATARDPLLSRVYGYIEHGWPRNVEIKQLEPYLARKSELYIEMGCVMWGYRVVVPEMCRSWVLRELHSAHMGIVKTKAYARSYVWWPGIDEAVEAQCRACATCAAVAPAPPAAPVAPWRWPNTPYERLHLDFLTIDGHTYLITVDARSKWVEAFKMARTTAEATIAKLRESWARWGIPRQAVTDNGPPFSSKQFANFLESNGVYHAFSAPYHPSSNGAAENAVKLIKNVIKKARRDRVDPELAIQRFLLIYHNTPHSTTGESPAQMLQGRRLRTRLDAVRPEHGKRLRSKELTAIGNSQGRRELKPGDPVWYKTFGSNTRWAEGEVVDRLGRTNYTVKTNDSSAAHRHIDQLKRRSTCVFPSEGTDAGGATGSGRPSLGSPSAASSVGSPRASPSSARVISQTVIRGSESPSVKATPVAVPDASPTTSTSPTATRIRRDRKPVVRYGIDYT